MAPTKTSTPDSGLAVGPSKLNPTDATLWDIERNPNLRTTIVAVLVLDRPVELTRLANMFEATSRLVPRFRQRVVGLPGGIGTPHWELDARFAVADHLAGVDLGGTIGSSELDAAITETAESMASTPLDRDRPLWECVYLGGTSGRSALVLKMHHSLTDGVGGIGMLDVLLDRERAAPPRDLSMIPEPVRKDPSSSGADDLGRATQRAVNLPWQVSSAVLSSALHPLRTAGATWGGARSAARLLAPTSAPLSTLMTDRSMDRSVGLSDVDLERLHAAAASHGCTINHAFIAGAVGGIAAYHHSLGASLDRIRITMPVSFRQRESSAAGNQWAPVRFVAPADIDDPVERMLAMRALVRSSRKEPALSFSQSLAGLVQVLPAMLSSAVVGGMMRGVDVTLTNVPGLTEPHYLGGAAVERIYAFAPTAGSALNIGLVSHLDTACIGTLSDDAAVADPRLLRDLVACGLVDVMNAAERTPAPAKDAALGNTEEPTCSASAIDHTAGPAAERLSALDTGFLRLETHTTPMHIGGVFTISGDGLRDADGNIRLGDARRHIEARVRRLRRFTRRLSEVPFGLGRPLWVDDEQFDIDNHVKMTEVPAPGGRQELLDVCAELHTESLDRSHPLWELWFVDGLTDGSVGLVEKVHHALIDGISGVELAAAIFDAEPADEPEQPITVRPNRGPTAMRRITDALVEQLTTPVVIARRTTTAMRTGPEQLMNRIGSVAATARDVIRPSARAPRTAFNQTIGTRRQLRSVDLELGKVQRLRQPVDATVNDVVLAVVAGAMRRWFEAAEQPLADVHVLVPVSTRSEGMTAAPGNQVGGVLVDLPVGEPDPVRRLQLVQHRMHRLKEAHEGQGSAFVLDALDHLPALGYGAATRLIAAQPLINFVVTNVPGPSDPLYFLGSRIDEMVPVVPLGPGLGLGIAVLSYVDRLTVSLFADPDVCHDIDALAAAIADEFTQLQTALAAVMIDPDEDVRL